MALHYDGEVRIVKVNMGPYNNNGYIVSCPDTNEGILIDTPAEPELLLNEVGDVSIKAERGCRFAPRCHMRNVVKSEFQIDCAEVEPRPVAVGLNQYSRCHLAEVGREVVG